MVNVEIPSGLTMGELKLLVLVSILKKSKWKRMVAAMTIHLTVEDRRIHN